MTTAASSEGRDPRIEQMATNARDYFASARRQARAEAEKAVKRERALRRRSSQR